MASNYIVWDAEILETLSKGDARFAHPENLTLTIACTIDHAGEHRSFYGNPEEIGEMLELFKRYQFVAGFNSTRFDNYLVDGLMGWSQGSLNALLGLKHIDLMAHIQKALGHRVSLASIGEALGMPKTGSGADAPAMWRAGKHKEVIAYCFQDVAITRAAYLSAAVHGYIPYATRGRIERAYVRVE